MKRFRFPWHRHRPAMTSKKKTSRTRKTRRKQEEDRSPRFLLVSVFVLFLFGFAGLKFLQSDRGAFYLLDRGWKDRYERVQEMVGASLDESLAELGIEPSARERSRAPLRSEGLTREVVNLRAELPPGLTLARANLALTRGVRAAGASVVLCREFRPNEGLGAIEMWVGSRRHPTHRLRLYEKGASRNFSEVGFRRPERPAEEGEPPFALEPEPYVASATIPPSAPAPSARLALVVDDFGYSLGRTPKAFLELDRDLTIAVLPDLPKTEKAANLAREMGHEVILHLPMEPEGYPGVDPGIPPVTSAMTGPEIRRMVETYLDQIGSPAGANNHMGSRATTDHRVMRTVLEVFAERGLYFFDSSTTPYSVIGGVRGDLDVPGATNDLFLDGEGESEEEIEARFEQLIAKARSRGYAVGICHPRQNTLRALRRGLPRLEDEGIDLVPLSQLVE